MPGVGGLIREAVSAWPGVLALSQIVDIDAPFWLGATAAITLVLIMVQAAAVGVLVPLGLKKLNFNPAVGTGVFITTINDLLGITILFLVAKVFYLPHLQAAAGAVSP
jgi:Mg/Co/Ni transporter MgtE